MGVLLGLPSPSRIPLFPFRSRREERGKERASRKGQGGRRPLSPSPIRTHGGRTPPSLWPTSSIPVWPNKPQYFSQRIPETLRYSKKYPNHSEPFGCSNIVVQYIDLYVSTISRLLVMSPISSGTLNYLRHIKSHKLIIPIITEH